MRTRLKKWAGAVGRDIVAVHLAARDPRVPRAAKILAIAVAAYALSPIDLIPDFIPVIGYLDDLILVPLAILLVVRLIPAAVMAELRAEAAARLAGPLPKNRTAAVVVVLLWLATTAALGWWAFSPAFSGGG